MMIRGSNAKNEKKVKNNLNVETITIQAQALGKKSTQ